MRPLDRSGLRSLCKWCVSILLLGVGLTSLAQVPAVLPRISVEGATATWSAPLSRPEAATPSAQRVVPRIMVEFASASMDLRLHRPVEAERAAAALQPRITIEFATAASRHLLERPSFAYGPEAVPPPPLPVATGTLRVAPGKELVEIVVRAPRSVLLVVDASGSMNEVVDGQPKIEIARNVLLDLVKAMPGELEVGLLVFKDCAAIDLVVPVGRLDRGRLGDAIRAIQPVGKTPIAGAIDRVPSAMAGHPEPYLVVLVTDGMETCDGQPVRAAQDLMAKGFDLRMHVIGYDVAGHADVQRQLRQIAAAADGKYFNADTTEELRRALQLATPIAYRIYDSANALVASGTVGGHEAKLPVGTFTVVIAATGGDLTVPVVVKDGAVTTVRLDYVNGVFTTRVE